MNTVTSICNKYFGRLIRPSILAVACTFTLVVTTSVAHAQHPPVHSLNAGTMPPGVIGSQQLLRGGQMPGYFQPIEILAPEGTQISFAANQQFGQPSPAPVKVGMLIAPVYRLRVTNIPHHDGFEVYPTIEVINRLYPPPGLEFKFPVPIEITQEEIEMALAGKFVTRVIYLENPKEAIPVAQHDKEQAWLEVRPHDDPMAVADSLGRPMAILRIGGRVPDIRTGPDDTFLFGCPPVLRFYPSEGQTLGSVSPTPVDSQAYYRDADPSQHSIIKTSGTANVYGGSTTR